MPKQLSSSGRDFIRNHIRQELESAEKDKSLDREGLTHLLSYWVIGLLENADTEELAKELFEESFSKIVATYLEKDSSNYKRMATALEIIPGTVKRWANGEAIPTDEMRKLVVKWIAAQK